MRVLTPALVATAAILGLVSTASAADLAYKVKAPVMAAPVWNWTGFYIGIQGGGGGMTDDPQQTFSPPLTVAGPNVVGTVNPLADPFGQNSFFPIPTPVGFQSISSANFSQFARNAFLVNGLTPFPLPHGLSPVTYAQLPTSFDSSNKLFGAAGVEAGYNYQTGNIVFGVNAAYNWLGSQAANHSFSSTGAFSGFGTTQPNNVGNGTNLACGDTPFSSCTYSGNSQLNGNTASKTDWLTYVGGRLGLAGFDNRVMAYVTGGAMFGKVNMMSMATYNDVVSFIGIPCVQVNIDCTGGTQTRTTNASYLGSSSTTKAGWAFGGGTNVAVTNNVYFKLEGLYYDLGRVSVTANGTGTTTCVSGPGFAPCVGGTAPNTGGVAAQGPITTAANVGSYTVTKQITGVLANIGIGLKF